LPIGAWVIEEACRQAANWRDEFARREPLAISVNLSAKQFSNGADLLEQIEWSLKAFALSPRLLHLEITESAIMRDPDVATVTLMELHRLGIEVHLDDFGTGYSSLGYLQRFPVDTLKIDRSFISSAASAAVRNPEIVQTITSLARSLSLTTTGEGIETAEQLAYLRSLGCTHGQGYYFSRPLNPADATCLIADWNAAQRVELTGQANVSYPI
jgi:EAL domain-containing protein (putative c-di-GMP-specific phosphodiesterase class I)